MFKKIVRYGTIVILASAIALALYTRFVMAPENTQASAPLETTEPANK